MADKNIQAAQAPAAPQPFVLTAENYYSKEADRLYLSNSLFKSVYGYPGDPWPCEAAALSGERQETEALLVGGYVDAAFESDAAFAKFKAEYEDALMLKSRKGYYKFVLDADIAIARARQDRVFMSYLDGSHQTVMTGKIAGHDFKIKMDDYKSGVRITDLKYVKSAAEAYNEALKRRVTFIEDYGYQVQGAIYREVVRQNTGRLLPFYIAYITKEENPDIGVVEVPSDMMDDALDYVKLMLTARPMAAVRAAPRMCSRRGCQFCRSRKVLSGPMPYADFEAYART